MTNEIIWPAFLPNQILVGNPMSNVAVVCGWTRRELMRDKLAAIDPKIMKLIAGIGQMYTAARGVDMMIRNLLANPRIDAVIFCGRDSSGASEEAYKFLNDKKPLITKQTSSGQNYVTTEGSPVRIWGDIPIERIDRVRHRITWIMPEVVYPVGASVPDVAIIQAIYRCVPKEFVYLVSTTDPRELRHLDEPLIYVPPTPKIEHYPAPNSVQVLRAKTVADGWLELLHYIMTYGKRIQTHYDQDTLEIMDLVMVITDQKPSITKEDLPPFMPFMHEHVQAYVVNLMSAEKKDDLTYTYGNLIRAHFGVDQLTNTAMKLAKEPDTRSAVISLWDPKNPTKGSPCLNHIWFRIINGKLNMTATIRSNDMFQGWPENAYGLRAMQEMMRCLIIAHQDGVADDKQILLGDLVIISQSAHIYADCWGPAKDIIAEHRRYKEWHDEKGQWIFEPRTKGVCNASLCAPDGERLFEFTGTPDQLRRIIASEGYVSDVGHALYVGSMLERAANPDKKPHENLSMEEAEK